MPIARDDIVEWLRACARSMAENKDYLTQLDAEIGDADHGINMDRGFAAVIAKLPPVQDKDVGAILRTAGMALVSTVGGAGGPLYGTFFMRMGMVSGGKYELADADVLAMLDAGVKGVVERGKANLGDKTMVDVLHPAVEALRQALANSMDVAQALERASDAAEAGMRATIPMKALKGRASYLGERSIGHQDPGATSSRLILQLLAEQAARRSGPS